MSSVDAPQSSETKENVISAKTRKSSFFLNPTSDSSNELIQLLLNELKEMRMEMKEMKEDVSVMKAEQDNQKEVLKEMKKEMKENKKSLEGIEENQKKLQEDVTGNKNKKSPEQVLHELKDDVLLKRKKTEKEAEVYSQEDIRRQINGKWRNVKYQDSFIWTKFEYGTFMIKHNRNDCFTRYRSGVKYKDGSTLSVENNTIVRRTFKGEGKEFRRYEYYIENGRLIEAYFYNGDEYSKQIHERVEDPDSE